MKSIKALWAYRGFITGSVQREFLSRYRNSLIGTSWAILHPLSMILVYTLIFSQVMSARLPDVADGLGYSIYLCAGILTWGLFSEITSRSVSIFIDNANLLKKVFFPRLCLPVVVVTNALLNFAIIFGLFTIFLLVSSHWPYAKYLMVFPLTAILVLFALGLGITLGVLNVFFRDVGHLFAIALQFWFWLTPIVYPISIIPESLRWIINLNPIAALIQAFQQVLVYAQWPDYVKLLYPLATAIVLCAMGLILFRRHAGEMVDEL